MIIKTIHMENFMRYEKAEIELSPGFNSIIGPSDAGKSTVLRALAWVMYSKPQGMEMCRDGSTETRVVLTLDSGVEIERYRSSKRNAYRLGDTWYDAIGGMVPEPVANALGVRLADLGKNPEQLNLSRQMDGPFLLSNTPGDAAKILGHLSGLTRIDRALSSLKPDINQAKKQIDISMKMQKNYDSSIGEFEGLEAELETIDILGKRLADANSLQARITSLTDIEQRMDEYNQIYTQADAQIQEQQAILGVKPELERATDLARRLADLENIEDLMLEHNYTSQQVSRGIIQEEASLNDLKSLYQETLHNLGQCPTCGAQT